MAVRNLEADRCGRVLLCAHVGTSMNPTLHETDLLEVTPCNGAAVRTGDVLLFVPAGVDRAVVHRVIEITAAGVRTQGDNNLEADTWLVQPDEIVGRVTAAQRGNRRRAVHGGLRGQVAARSVQTRRSTAASVGRALGPMYRVLVRSRLVTRLLPDAFQPRLVQFCSGGKQRLRLTLGRRPIGYFDVDARAWRIGRWYRLLVDERSLPFSQ